MTRPDERFWAKTDPCRTDGCIVWMGARSHGYGSFKLDGRMIPAHHFLAGKAPAGLEWDHLCRVPACVNPEHLEAVTRRENTLRGLHGRLITNCPQGHPYDEVNTYITPRGARRCRLCQQKREAERPLRQPRKR